MQPFVALRSVDGKTTRYVFCSRPNVFVVLKTFEGPTFTTKIWTTDHFDIDKNKWHTNVPFEPSAAEWRQAAKAIEQSIRSLLSCGGEC